MPKLLLFVPCRHVAYDASDQTASLLGLFQGFAISLVKVEKPGLGVRESVAQVAGDKPVGLPLHWVAFSMWRKLPSDEGKKFVQFCELKKPDGSVTTLSPLEFTMTRSFQRNALNIQNFPVDQEGDYVLRLLLKEENGDTEVVSEYPILVSHRIDAEN